METVSLKLVTVVARRCRDSLIDTLKGSGRRVHAHRGPRRGMRGRRVGSCRATTCGSKSSSPRVAGQILECISANSSELRRRGVDDRRARGTRREYAEEGLAGGERSNDDARTPRRCRADAPRPKGACGLPWRLVHFLAHGLRFRGLAVGTRCPCYRPRPSGVAPSFTDSSNCGVPDARTDSLPLVARLTNRRGTEGRELGVRWCR